MATVTNVFMTAADGAVTASYSYDDVSLLINTASLTNDATRGTLTIDLRDPDTSAFIFGPVSRNFGSGSFTMNVSAKHWFMQSVVFTDKSGNQQTVFVPPFLIDVAWSLA